MLRLLSSVCFDHRGLNWMRLLVLYYDFNYGIKLVRRLHSETFKGLKKDEITSDKTYGSRLLVSYIKIAKDSILLLVCSCKMSKYMYLLSYISSQQTRKGVRQSEMVIY